MGFDYRNIDCMKGMKEYPDKYFDLAIVDPPYGIGETWKKNRRGSKSFNGTYRNESPPNKSYFVELKRVAKEYIVFGANFYDFAWPTKNVIVWDKVCKWETDHKAEAEIAITSLNHRPISIFSFPWSGGRKGNETGIQIVHPHQKPVALYKWLLTNYAKQGDKILDTHVGSASSIIACLDMGFDVTGFELDPDYYKASMERINKYLSEPKIFTPEQMKFEQSLLFNKE